MQENECIARVAAQMKGGRVALWCGAGISIPSGLPPATGMAGWICEHLCPKEASREVLLEEVCCSHRIPFEAFIEILIRISGNGSFLEMFSEGAPTRAHLLAAKLVKKGWLGTVGTTNFDLLFERALAMVGVNPDKWQCLSADADFEGLETAQLADLAFTLLKIHGSYSSDISCMITTLQQLGQRISVEARMDGVDLLFRSGSHDTVLMLGYSCSDVFDINPRIIASGPDLKTIIIVQHSHGPDTEVIQLKTVKELPVFSNTNDQSYLIRTDTDAFLLKLQGELGIDIPSLTVARSLWLSHLDRWFSAIAPSAADRIVAAAFRRSGHYELAEIHYIEAIRLLEPQGASETLADVIVQLGALHQLMGKYQTALDTYNKALNLLPNSPSRVRSTALYQIGRVFEETGDFRGALKGYEESMSIDQCLGDEQGIASCLHQTGIIYQDYFHDWNEAESRYKRSLIIKNRLGDLEGIFNSLHQLSTLALVRDRYDEALHLNGEALDLALRLNLRHSIAYARGLRGHILQFQDRFDEAEWELRQSLRIREELKDIRGASRCYHRLAQVDWRRGHLCMAIKSMVLAIRQKTTIGDRFGLAEDLFQFGLILEDARHVIWGQVARSAARKIFEELGCEKEAEACGSKASS